MTHKKGTFFFEEDGSIIGHQYDLKLSKDTSVWITIEPFSLRPGGLWPLINFFISDGAMQTLSCWHYAHSARNIDQMKPKGASWASSKVFALVCPAQNWQEYSMDVLLGYSASLSMPAVTIAVVCLHVTIVQFVVSWYYTGDLSSAREKQRAPIDTMLLVLRDDGSLVTFTEMRDMKGVGIKSVILHHCSSSKCCTFYKFCTCSWHLDL